MTAHWLHIKFLIMIHKGLHDLHPHLPFLLCPWPLCTFYFFKPDTKKKKESKSQKSPTLPEISFTLIFIVMNQKSQDKRKTGLGFQWSFISCQRQATSAVSATLCLTAMPSGALSRCSPELAPLPWGFKHKAVPTQTAQSFCRT